MIQLAALSNGQIAWKVNAPNLKADGGRKRKNVWSTGQWRLMRLKEENHKNYRHIWLTNGYSDKLEHYKRQYHPNRPKRSNGEGPRPLVKVRLDTQATRQKVIWNSKRLPTNLPTRINPNRAPNSTCSIGNSERSCREGVRTEKMQ